MFVITTTSIARKHHLLPAWFVWAGSAVGLFLLLTASLDRVFFLLSPAWVLILGGILLAPARKMKV